MPSWNEASQKTVGAIAAMLPLFKNGEARYLGEKWHRTFAGIFEYYSSSGWIRSWLLYPRNLSINFLNHQRQIEKMKSILLLLAFSMTSGLGLAAEATGTTQSPKIDCHVHLYLLSRPEGIGWIAKDNPVLYRDHRPEDFAAIAKANGVTGVVLVQAGQSLPDNQWNLDVSEGNKELFRGVVGNLSLVIGTDKFEPLFEKLIEDPRYLGYRLSGRPANELNDAFYDHLKATAKAGKSVDFLLGSYTLKEVAEVAQRVPELRIIIDHFGGVQLDGQPLDAQWVEDFKAVAEFPNVYCKVSALYGRVAKQPAPMELEFYKEVLDLAWESFGEDRLVFGSDWPVTKTTGDYASVLKLTRSYFEPLGEKVCEKLFHRNAEKFYAIPDVE